MSYGETPYQSPQQPQFTNYQTDASGKPKKPGGLLAVSIIVLILGIMGVLGGLCGMGLSAGASGIAGFFEDQITDDMSDQQRQQMESAVVPYKAMEKNMVFLLVSALISTVASILMIVAGTMGLKGSPAGRQWLIIALVACIVSGLIGAGVNMMNSATTSQIMAERNPELADQMGASNMIGMVVGSAFGVLFIIGYIAMLIYILISKSVKQYYAVIS